MDFCFNRHGSVAFGRLQERAPCCLRDRRFCREGHFVGFLVFPPTLIFRSRCARRTLRCASVKDSMPQRDFPGVAIFSITLPSFRVPSSTSTPPGCFESVRKARRPAVSRPGLIGQPPSTPLQPLWLMCAADLPLPQVYQFVTSSASHVGEAAGVARLVHRSLAPVPLPVLQVSPASCCYPPPRSCFLLPTR